MESDQNGYRYIMGNGQMILGLQMASNAFRIIHGAKLGKHNMLPECLGSDLVRGNNGLVGRGEGKKRRAACNELHRGLKFAST